jgi:glyoxylase-like metal-dependent hydrolase (beta-lactamase superfamily II)
VDGTELVSGARLVADGFTLAYVVPIGEREVALIDCGVDPQAKAISAELARRKLDDSAVTHIFLTHGHGDHTGGCKNFPRAQLAALKEEAPLLAGTSGRSSPMSMVVGQKPSGLTVQPLSEGDTVMLGEHALHVYRVPGHTEGSAAYLLDGVLYLGDSAGASSSGGLMGAAWVFSLSTKENRAALGALTRRLPAGEVKQLAFGHTGPADARALTEFVP